MNRREFCQGAICTAIGVTLPTLPPLAETWTRSWDTDAWKSSRGRTVTEEQLVEKGFNKVELEAALEEAWRQVCE